MTYSLPDPTLKDISYSFPPKGSQWKKHVCCDHPIFVELGVQPAVHIFNYQFLKSFPSVLLSTSSARHGGIVKGIRNQNQMQVYSWHLKSLSSNDDILSPLELWSLRKPKKWSDQQKIPKWKQKTSAFSQWRFTVNHIESVDISPMQAMIFSHLQRLTQWGKWMDQPRRHRHAPPHATPLPQRGPQPRESEKKSCEV